MVRVPILTMMHMHPWATGVENDEMRKEMQSSRYLGGDFVVVPSPVPSIEIDYDIPVPLPIRTTAISSR